MKFCKQKEKVVQVVLFKELLMKFEVTKWTIKELLEKYNADVLNLSPKYQRNFIWSIKDQQYLIDSIKKNNPIPNFFVLQKNKKEIEMVDGQQRSRTILGFINKQFKDFEGKYFNEKDFPHFLNYTFPVTIISDTQGESIENFYAVVNKTGIHLNKPEVRKADYYNTNLLKLINKITESKKIKNLKLFTEASLKRMNDTDFISELFILILKGHVDKKNHIDDYFKNDITEKKSEEIDLIFNEILDKILVLNKTFEISKTRYKQRNDFYTLFDFILNNRNLNTETLSYFYKILVIIASDIKPSQENCKPLMEYARNCVTQSNSKTARENRLNFFNDLFLNKSTTSNETQNDILNFYSIEKSNLIKKEDYYTISFEDLNNLKNVSFKL